MVTISESKFFTIPNWPRQVSVTDFSGNNCPGDMKITVKKEGEAYWAYCNYAQKTKNAATTYQAMNFHPTEKEALTLLLMNLKPGKDSEWVKV